MNDQGTIQADQAQAVDAAHGDEVTTADARDGAEAKLVPVSEARRYRRRAQAAEQAAADLQAELAAREATVALKEEMIADLQRGQQIDDKLIEAGAIDLESTRLLVELEYGSMDEPTVDAAMHEVMRRKPFLFRRPARRSGAMGPHDADGAAHDEALEDAADEAATTGHRRDLLHYLRLRRGRGRD